MTIKTTTVLVDRLKHALDKQGVKLKRRALLETTAYAFGYSSSNAFTNAAEEGDIAAPPVTIVGSVVLPNGRAIVIVNDPLANAPYAMDRTSMRNMVGPQGREPIGITPYGNLVDIGHLAEADIPNLMACADADPNRAISLAETAASHLAGYKADQNDERSVESAREMLVSAIRRMREDDAAAAVDDIRMAIDLVSTGLTDDADANVADAVEAMHGALGSIERAGSTKVVKQRPDDSCLRPFLMAALEQIDLEIENRQGGIDPTTWADLEKVSYLGHAAAWNIDALTVSDDDAESIRISRKDLGQLLKAAEANCDDARIDLQDGIDEKDEDRNVGRIGQAIENVRLRLAMPVQTRAPATKPTQAVMTVHVARIVHKHGSDTKVALNEADLEAQVAKYCRENWNEVSDQKGVPSDPAGMTDHEVATTYYSAMEGMESEDHLDEQTFEVPFENSWGTRNAVVPVRTTNPLADAESIAAELEEGVSSDIWYDAHDFGSDEPQNADRIAESSIERTQNAMIEAARILRHLKPILLADGGITVDGRLLSKTAIAERASRDGRDDIRYITYRNGEEGDVTITMAATLGLGYVNSRSDGIPLTDAEHEWISFGHTLNDDGSHPVSLGASAVWHGRKWLVAEIEFPFCDQGDDSRDDAAALRRANEHMEHVVPWVEAMGSLMNLDEDATEFAHELAILIPFEFATESCSIDDWHKALAYALSTEQEKDARVTVSAEYTAQMELGRGVYSTEPLGDTVWDATFDALRWGRKHAEDVLEGDATLQDEYAHSPLAPKWVRERSQFHPFEVESINLDELYGID